MRAPGSSESRLKGLIAYQGYRWLARFAEILPQSAISGVARLAARIGVAVLPIRRRLVTSHLRRVTKQEPTRSAVRRTFANYIAYWLTALRLPSVPSETLQHQVRVENMAYLDTALKEHKGVILALSHLGNWDVAGRWLVTSGVPLTVVAERLKPEKLHTWFKDFRESLGFGVLENGANVASDIAEALRANRAVALLCDRDVDGTGRPVEFFGEQTPLPVGPAVLALRTGAALIPVGIYTDTRGGFRVVVHPRINIERQGEFRSDVSRVHTELVGELERMISVDPEQWHLFGPNWPSDSAITS